MEQHWGFQPAGEHEALRSSVRALAEREIAPYSAEVDRQERYPQEAYDALSKAGYHAINIAEEYGGHGADAAGICVVVEEVARVDATASLIPMVNRLATQPILLAGSDELRKLVLPSIAAGGASASYALTEREAGSDTASMRTTARPDGDTWVLDGAKCWIAHAGISTWYVVMAVTDQHAARKSDGISAFVVHKDDPGFSVGEPEHTMGLRGSSTREIYFDRCVIPADRVIGELGTGLKTALLTLDHTRPMVGAQALGIAQGALDASVAYVQQRRQFGKAIADFQGIRFMLADMGMKIEAARHLVYAAAAATQRGDIRGTFMAAAAKTYASDIAMSVTTDAVQLFGGAGYSRDHPVERMMRDAKVTQIYEGTNQIQRMVMARALLAR
ncbi:acyl-CoA dehydrogenase family protein [Amycolatopsis sp. NBC_00345]|uniref:acyl-CoA dehydrogenase family protein n=1 Tax=Amycolatopsis sp. NBC_00345 TaxID=2975955 RepID=UPI002E265242